MIDIVLGKDFPPDRKRMLLSAICYNFIDILEDAICLNEEDKIQVERLYKTLNRSNMVFKDHHIDAIFEKHKDILKDFISACLPLEKKEEKKEQTGQPELDLN